ncbi:pectinesterase family protein [Actinomadura sp. ATCC 31491]|uniref:Pectinesterase family protein n=1 Tax=Actinomadura luzonensis TaxID=2805427 RepID=A0ABT0G6D1_9ACTN|nr:pectinesterase family protein [Actinomadura luzonensis]MCK2220064.1 pectinesterase family protein [Actinomadura luzonensis]
MRLLLVIPLLLAFAATPPAQARTRTVIVVAADGSGDHPTVQAAVDAVPAGNTRPVTILVRKGTYRQQVVIPADKAYISLVGDTRDPREVVLTSGLSAATPKPDGSGTYGTSGSASYVISAPDFTARNLTFENSYDEAANGPSQAVAVRTTGDRQVYENVRFLGNQDTLYANTASAATTARQYFRDCYVEGDVDVIFGRATAVFDNCVIKSLNRGSADNNGYVTAASTEITNPYGFLIYRSHLVSDAPARSVHLGRPWPAGGSATARGQVLVRESWLGQHVKDAPWTDMSGLSWRDARLSEYRDEGPGAAVNADRPQLTPEQAAGLTPQRYLAGSDGWNPVRRSPARPDPYGVGRQALPAGDGWAAATTGTTGGSAARPENVHVVTTRAQLKAALADPPDNSPRIIYVKGAVDADTDDTGRALTCDDYAVNGYSLPAYLAAYDPAVWGRASVPSGPLEEARKASYAKMAEHVTVTIGSNVTLVGVGRDAALKSFGLRVSNADNVIVRNLTITDTADCFPQWDPTDGAEGNWNASFDNVEVSGSTHVWIDHNTLNDGANPDSGRPLYFGRPHQVHDGLLDVVRGSDLVTLSWNHLSDHDKVMLIGNTDNPARYAEEDKLKVTLHHNWFEGLGQRTPRVRFGQVHVYDNYFTGGPAHGYSIGVGVGSKVHAESNAFDGIPAATVLTVFGGTAITAKDNLVDGAPVDLVAAYNAANGASLGSDAGWTPALVARKDPARALKAIVPAGAGAGRRL